MDLMEKLFAKKVNINAVNSVSEVTGGQVSSGLELNRSSGIIMKDGG